MIIREILTNPERVANFDHFNDYYDTAAFLYTTETFEAFEILLALSSRHHDWLKSRTQKSRTGKLATDVILDAANGNPDETAMWLYELSQMRDFSKDTGDFMERFEPWLSAKLKEFDGKAAINGKTCEWVRGTDLEGAAYRTKCGFIRRDVNPYCSKCGGWVTEKGGEL